MTLKTISVKVKIIKISNIQNAQWIWWRVLTRTLELHNRFLLLSDFCRMHLPFHVGVQNEFKGVWFN
jgi:hypothetical protein